MSRIRIVCLMLGWVSAGLAAQLGAPTWAIFVVGFAVTFVSTNAVS